MSADPSASDPPPLPLSPTSFPKVLRTRQSTGSELFVIAGIVGVVLAAAVGLMLLMPGARALLNMAAVARDQKVQFKPLEPPPPLTAAQQAALEQFGRELARAIRLRDMGKLNLLLDDEALAGRVFEKLPDVLEAPGSRTRLIDNLRRNDSRWLLDLTGGEAEYLRTGMREGFPAVVLRTGRGPANYADLLVRPEGGSFKVVDGFNRLLAWTVSDDACYWLASEAAVRDADVLAGLPGITAETPPQVIKELPGLVGAVRLVRVVDVLFFVDGLPPEVDKEPLFFRQRLQALRRLDSLGDRQQAGAYKAALREAPGILGADCTADAALADLLRMENDHAGVEECLKRAEAAVGGDPHLAFQRADNCLVMKKHAEALAHLDAAEKASARTEKTAGLRIAVQVDRKDYPAVVEELRAYKQSFGVVLGRQNHFMSPASQDFLASPEFAAWEKENTAGVQ